MDYFDGVARALVSLAPDQRLVGKVRLQKVAYLLNALGLQTGLSFAYHHYGPYSRDLDLGTDEALSLGWIKEERERRKGDGAPYSVFMLEPEVQDAPEAEFAGLEETRAKALVAKFCGVSATVLELAATAHWLVAVEGVVDWQDEIRLRKGVKTEAGRLDKAVELLRDCGLPPGFNA